MTSNTPPARPDNHAARAEGPALAVRTKHAPPGGNALRRFQPGVMSQTIRAAIDAVACRLAGEPGLNLAAWATELADLSGHAASSSPPASRRRETT